jgi:uncharacterized protein (TIGR00369 family)
MSDHVMHQDPLGVINAMPNGWGRAMGLRFVEAAPDTLTAEMAIGPQHRQPYGLVHGGVYAGIVEELASVAATLHVMPRGQRAVGLENHTCFVAACREGTLHARATPVTRGSRTHVWDVSITDGAGKLLATGRVRLLILDAQSTVAGGALAIPGA